jgi:hypothetical protein
MKEPSGWESQVREGGKEIADDSNWKTKAGPTSDPMIT